MFSQINPVGMMVLGLLLLFSIVSWAIIFSKIFAIKSAQRSAEELAELLWTQRRLEAVFASGQRLSSSPAGRLFSKGYEEWRRGKASGQEPHFSATFSGSGDMFHVEHALRRGVKSEMQALERMVPFLATVGATSPFIGLFGTVVGIMNAFHDIGAEGSASLATVAPGMSEALVATAAGLLAAIPAVMAYNFFSNRLRAVGAELETLSHDFIVLAKEQ
jgi:biopolymer transport protein TolQ